MVSGRMGRNRAFATSYGFAAAPMAMAAAPAAAKFADSFDETAKSKAGEVVSSDSFDGEPMGGGADHEVQPVVRTNFADTAFWAAALSTAADGTAEVEFPLPESLTTWKVKAWTLGPGTARGPG